MKHVYIVEIFKSEMFLGLKVFVNKKSAERFVKLKEFFGYETSTRRERVSK